MKLFHIALVMSLGLGSYTIAAEPTTDTNAPPEAQKAPGDDSGVSTVGDEVFLQAVIKQIQERKSAEAKTEAELIQSLKARYPDLFPPRDSYPSLRFYHQTFDATLANTLYFAPGSSYLNAVQKEKIQAIATAMEEAPDTSLIIEGHSANNYHIEDNKKRLYYNRWISGRRAVQVWSYLTEYLGVNPNRIAMYTLDAQRPLNDEKNETQRALNRRVEMRLTNQPIDVTGRTNPTRAAATAPSRPINQ